MIYNDENISPKKHTTLGISAFISSIIFVIIWMIVLGLSSMFYNAQPEAHPIMSFLGWMIVGTFLLFFIPLILGIAASKEENVNKVFPVIAISISSIGIIATIVIILIGRFS